MLLTAAALLLRVHGLGRSGFWVDEVSSVHCVEGSFSELRDCLSAAPSALGLSNANTNPPLYFTLLWGWSKLFGLGESALRLPSALLGAATVPLTGRLAGSLFGPAAVLPAAALLAFHPGHLIYSREARPYSLGIFLLVVLGCLAVRMASPLPSRGEGRPVLSGVEGVRGLAAALAATASAVIATQYALTPIALALYAWCFLRSRSRRWPAALSLLPLAVLLALLPALAEQLSDGSAQFAASGTRLVFEPPGSFALFVQSALLLSGLGASDFPIPLTTAYLPAWATLATLASVLVLAVGALLRVSRSPALWLPFCFAGLLFIADAFHPFLFSRYLLFALPFLTIGAAGWLSEGSKRRAAILALGLAPGWLWVSWTVTRPLWEKSKEREIAEALQPLRTGNDYLVCVPGNFRDSLTFYLRLKVPGTLWRVRTDKARFLVVDLSGTIGGMPGFWRRLKDVPWKPVHTLRWEPAVPSDHAVYGALFESPHPERTLRALEEALREYRPPFDLHPVRRI